MTSNLTTQLTRAQQALDHAHYDDAIRVLSALHVAVPDDASIGMMLANAHHLVGDRVGACDVLLNTHARATITDPATALSFGTALLDVGAAVEAAEHFAFVTRLHPRDPAGLAALASATRAAGQPDKAWACMRRALAIAPNHPTLLFTAAQIRHDLGDLPGALAWLDQADAVRPNHAPTQMQRAYTTLLGGASRAGWRLFESRPLPAPTTDARAWHGEPLDGATILVTAEQGVGDQFQFARFTSLLTERGAARVFVECHVDAVSLLMGSGYHAVARGSNTPSDWHVPLLSLPYRLGLDDEVRGDAVPYLRRAPAAPRGGDRARVGLVWSGNPAFSGRLLRDLPPDMIREVITDQRAHWMSLQQGGRGRDDVPALPQALTAPDWKATASLLASLDGLVTTDTGIAHLAGAMGVPTWVLLQHVPDWRWGLSGTGTPWYPSVRLIRQRAPNDWPSVISALRTDPGFTALVDRCGAP